jgi:hypothetical protein
MTRAAIDTGALLKMLYSSLAASIGIAVIVSTAILGAIRAGETRRQHRRGTAAAYATLAVAGILLAAGIVVYGLVLIARKS